MGIKKAIVAVILLLATAAGCAAPPRMAIRRDSTGVYHSVKPGETFWRICRTYEVDMQEAAELNNIKDPSRIKAGQRIFIPGRRELRKIVPYRPEKGERIEKVVVEKGRFAWPVRGAVISQFGPRGGSMHEGIDIKAPLGTPVRAANNGKVVYSSDGMRGYGNVIIIEHPESFYTVYAHNRKNLARRGGSVRKGDMIAEVGNSGNASTPHLHFEIRHGRRTRNPLFFLP